MFSGTDLVRLATLKRNTTILEQTAPSSAGGLSAAVITDQVHLTTWVPEQEITIVLTVEEVFELRRFLNAVVDAALQGAEYPHAFIGSRK